MTAILISIVQPVAEFLLEQPPSVSEIPDEHGCDDENRADRRLAQLVGRREKPVANVVVQRDEAAHQYERHQEQDRQAGSGQMPGQRGTVMREAKPAARHEMARTVDDVLARRTRALFLNSRAAIAVAPRVASLLATELRRGHDWEQSQVEAFGEIARNYILTA